MAWFGKHWRLVRSLRTDAGFGDAALHKAIDKGLADAAARCKDAMAEAQGDAGIPQLQSVRGFASTIAALFHLQTFTELTSLRLQGLKRKSPSILDRAEACAAVAGLVSLRCLSINVQTDDLLPATSCLTNLTSLSVEHLTPYQGAPNLWYLPAQLQELTMTLYLDGDDQPHIDLSHVTGLTRLMAPAVERTEHDGWVVGFGGVGDKLPPNCRHLSVEDVLSAQPLLELQHLERLELQSCWSSDEHVHGALQQLSSLSSLTGLYINMEVGELDEVVADALLALPCLQGLRLWFSGLEAEDRFNGFDVETPVLRQLVLLTALQSLSMSKLALPDSSELRMVDAVRGMRGLQSLRLDGCYIPELAIVVEAIAGLPELRDVRLADLPKWDEAASTALTAATQLTGLMLVSGRVHSLEFVSLVGQVHKLSGLRRLWMHSPGMDRFNVDAGAASLTGLTELCVRDCDPQLLGAKFPHAALGHIRFDSGQWLDDPLRRHAWQVRWWSPAEGEWTRD